MGEGKIKRTNEQNRPDYITDTNSLIQLTSASRHGRTPCSIRKAGELATACESVA